MAEQNAGGVPLATDPNKPYQQFNGIHSSHSSRSSSPSVRSGQIPASQLPPVRPIPQSQLPPSRSSLTTVTHQVGGLSINENTPNVSPKFNTSTPNAPKVPSFNQNTVISPVSSLQGTTAPNSTQSQQIRTNVGQNVQQIPQSQFNSNTMQLPPVASFQNRAPVNNNQPSGQNFGFPTQQIKTSLPSRTPGLVNNFNYQAPVQNVSNYQQSTSVAQNDKSSSIPPAFRQNFNANVLPSLTNYNNGPPVPPITQKANLHSNRYPTSPPGNLQQQQYQYPSNYQQNSYQQYNQQPQYPQSNVYPSPNAYPSQQPPQPYKSVVQSGFNTFMGMDSIDLLSTPNILPPRKLEAPKIHLGQEALDQANCSPDIFRCTMTKIPENNSLLQKSRLPLGVLIHPFKDLSHLPVIQCNVIVRCRACRTYINPFVFFVDTKRWKCNLCYRVNELPEEFQYDPVTKTYGDPSRRPEIKSSTLEYIAPAEYMLRPPQPAVYLYLLDVSRLAVESGYLSIMSAVMFEEIRNIPGDSRTQIGFIAYDSALHFYSLPEGISQPHEMTVLDIEDVFLPTPDNLLVNLKDKKELVMDLLEQLPNRYLNTYDNNSALGAALQVAFKMMGATGGRVTVFQASLPNIGPGALTSREDPSQRASVEVSHLNPANDFYKRLALEFSGQQIAVDLFLINSQYVDLATISGISRFSGGCIHHCPLLRPNNALMNGRFARCFRRYLTRKIGFEAVMRIRCTRGLSIHTFHGNFFVRSTDLLSLPNINPDAGFGMQVAIEESLSDVQTVCFQAALLYTSSKGERRIRVHTLCLPVAATLQDVIHSADQECIVGLLSKMAVDRSMQSNLSDAREAFSNVAIDILSSYKLSLNLGTPVSGLMAPSCLSLLPLFISAIMKHAAFRTGTATRLDDRVMGMIEMKTKPLYLLMQQIYPDLYPIHNLETQEIILNAEEEQIHLPPRLQLTARCLDSKGAFLMDAGDHIIILVCPNVPLEFLNEALGVQDYNSIPEEMYELPIVNNPRNQRLHEFVNYLNEEKPFAATLHVMRDNSNGRVAFFQKLIEDRLENALSYHEFLQHLKTQVK